LQAPLDLALGTADLVITTNTKSLTRPIRVVALRAGIFAVTHAADFSLVTAENPAVPGEYLAIFATGLGPTSPSVAAGEVSPLALAPLTSGATVVPGVGAVGGGPISPALYAGLAPGTVGIYQVNCQLSTEIGSGVSGLYLEIGSHGDQTNMAPLYVK
jgi:uncharacterized protein (TIGR03437 family)